MRRLAVLLPVLLAAGLAAGLVSVTAAWAAGWYPSGATGFDASSSLCGLTPVAGTSFGIIGVNGGRPFTQNSCLGVEYATAGNGGVYVNTGYAKAYARKITPDCQTRSAGYSTSSSLQQAYAIGCSEAESSQSYAAGQGVTPPVWWLDVETANSWSTSNLALNDATIQGLLDILHGTGASVGVYSTGYQWGKIAGGTWTPAGVSAAWVAGASEATAPGYCSQSFLSGVAVWLVQYTSGSYDYDYSC
jgi:hypothetical protein